MAWIGREWSGLHVGVIGISTLASGSVPQSTAGLDDDQHGCFVVKLSLKQVAGEHPSNGSVAYWFAFLTAG